MFTSPASGSIYYCSTPDPEMERALVRNRFIFLFYFSFYWKPTGNLRVQWANELHSHAEAHRRASPPGPLLEA